MRPDLDEALTRDFPCLFRLRHRGERGAPAEVRPLGKTPFDVALSETFTEYHDVFEALADGPREPISSGFEIEDGWEPIVRRLAGKLEPIARQTGTLVCVQVKEKNGGLRFYVEHGALPADVVGMVRAAVAEARDQSARTCELCGADGILRGAGHVQTLCAPCADRLAELEPEMPEPTKIPLDLFGRVREPGEDDEYKPLLTRRVPRENIALGRAYVIHARHGGVGVAVEKGGLLGYRLHRVKWGHHYLSVEYDWADDPNFGLDPAEHHRGRTAHWP
jgi:hypothetical protein